MIVFSLDVETKSRASLPRAGVHRYLADEEADCLLLAYHPVGDASAPRVWRRGEPPPEDLVQHVLSGGRFAGWNIIGFDRFVWKLILVPRYGFPEIPDDNWLDSMHRAAAANLPRSLDGACKALGVSYVSDLKDNNRIRRITDANRTPNPSAEDLQWLADRCVQDVLMEEQALLRMPPWPGMQPWLAMPAIDRRINDRGILMDVPLVQGLAKAAHLETARLDTEIAELTRGEVPATTNVEKLKAWLVASGVELPKAEEDDAEDGTEVDVSEPLPNKSLWRLRKSDIADILARDDLSPVCRQVMEIRAEAAKASTKKLNAMLRVVHPDGRLRGALILGGAQQTLRWSGAVWQPHNFPRDPIAKPGRVAKDNGLDEKKDKARVAELAQVALRAAVECGRSGDPDAIRAVWGDVLPFASAMLRRTLSAPAGMLLLNGDFSQVEARITAWLAGQTNIVEAFARGDDVYRIAAAGIYDTTPDKIDGKQRQVGKVAVLALGFGGGVGAFPAMAMNYGLKVSREQAKPIVDGFRSSNRAIADYWAATDAAAAAAIQYPGREFPVAPHGLVSYRFDGQALLCRLPSGRHLRYWAPRMQQGFWPDGRPKDSLELTGLAIKGRAVFRRSLYHTILVENQVQAIAADLMGNGLANLDTAGIPVVLHVHDAAAAEVAEERAEDTLPTFKQAMLAAPDWARGLPLAVDCEVSARFG